MGILSNFLGRPDSSGLAPRCRPAKPEEIHQALRLVLSAGDLPADSQQVIDFISLAHQRGINLGDVWICERQGRMIWAVLPVLSPGRTVLLLLPPRPDKEDALAALVDAVCGEFSRRNTHLAQLLLDPQDTEGQRLFASHGFRRMAELIYLQTEVRPNTPPPLLPQSFAWTAYSPASHALFAQTIAASYRDSLDCPGLNGMRDIEDVIAGHKASGQFEPRHWYVLSENGVPCGTLLVSRLANMDAAELVYTGLVPEARQRGLAPLLMHQALASTSQMGVSRLSLAVDSGNTPALKLYYRFGFARAGSKVAMMRILAE